MISIHSSQRKCKTQKVRFTECGHKILLLSEDSTTQLDPQRLSTESGRRTHTEHTCLGRPKPMWKTNDAAVELCTHTSSAVNTLVSFYTSNALHISMSSLHNAHFSAVPILALVQIHTWRSLVHAQVPSHSSFIWNGLHLGPRELTEVLHVSSNDQSHV